MVLHVHPCIAHIINNLDGKKKKKKKKLGYVLIHIDLFLVFFVPLINKMKDNNMLLTSLLYHG